MRLTSNIKHNTFQFRKIAIFKLETRSLEKVQLLDQKEIFRLETRFLHWKEEFQIGNTIFRPETGDFQLEITIFTLETRF